MTRRTLLTTLILSLVAAIGFPAPPGQSGSADSSGATAPLDEPASAESLDQRETEFSSERAPRKYIEIHIDDRGIRAIDESGDEHILSESPKHGYRGRSEDWERRDLSEVGERAGTEAPRVDVGDIYIAYDQEINTNVIAGGNVKVDGIVNGNIVSMKTVRLGPEAVVTGQIIAKRLEMDSNAVFKGEHLEVDLGNLLPGLLGTMSERAGLPGPGPWIIVTVFVVMLTSMFLIVFQRPVKRVEFQLAGGFLRNFGTGLLIVLAILPFFLLLSITIVLIPVAVLVYPLAIAGALILGQVGAACYLGTSLGNMFSGLRFNSTYLGAIVGVGALMASWIVSGFFVLVGSQALSVFFFVFGIIFMTVMGMAGLGAVWFSRFGTRPREIDTITPEPLPSQVPG